MELLFALFMFCIFGALCGLISHFFFDDNRSKSDQEIKVQKKANSDIKLFEKISEDKQSTKETKKQTFNDNEFNIQLLKNYVCNYKNHKSEGIVISSIKFIPDSKYYIPYIIGKLKISQELKSLLDLNLQNSNFIELRLYGEEVREIIEKSSNAKHKIDNNTIRNFSEKHDGLIFKICTNNDEAKAKIRRYDESNINYIDVTIKDRIKFYSIAWNKSYNQQIIDNKTELIKNNHNNETQKKSDSIVYTTENFQKIENFQDNINLKNIKSTNKDDLKYTKQMVFNEGNKADEHKDLKIVGQVKPRTSSEIDQLKTIIDSKFAEFNVRSFWHISHINNIKSILHNGILSNNTAKKSNLPYLDISDPSVQRWREFLDPHYHRKIHEYAPLYINPKNPMLYVRKDLQDNLCLLEVSLSVIVEHEYLISDGNASAKNTCFFNSLDNLHLLSWDVIHSKMWTEFEDGKRKKCAEILVYPKIEPEYILNIHCKTQESKKKILEYFKNTYLSPNLFF